MAEGPKTVYLGQFTDENGEKIAEELEGAGIFWYYKQPGWLTEKIFAGEWGVRLFVDQERLDDARAIAERVAGPL